MIIGNREFKEGTHIMGILNVTDDSFYVLVRATFTETQTKKSRFNRWQNVKDVFQAANKEQLAGKHVLVCDDVLTTGATTEAAIQKLLEVLGVRVSVVTLATAK